MASHQEIENFIKQAFGIPQSFKSRIHLQNTPTSRSLDAANNELLDYQSYLDKLDTGEVNPQLGIKLHSSVHGKIQALLFSLPYYEGRYVLPKDTILDIAKKFNNSVDIYIYSVYNEEDINVNIFDKTTPGLKADLRSLAKQLGRRLFLFKAHNGPKKFSQWIRDPFVVARARQGQVVLLEPFNFTRHCPATIVPGNNKCLITSLSSDDQEVANNIALSELHLQPQHVETNLIFHGGNVMVGDEFILIGEDFFDVNRQQRDSFQQAYNLQPGRFSHLSIEDPRLSTDDQEIIKEFKKQFSGTDNTKIIKIGSPPPVSFAAAQGERVTIIHQQKKYLSDWLFFGKEQPFFHLDLFITLIGENVKTGKYEVLLPQIVNASGIYHHELYQHIIFPWNQWLNKIARQLIKEGFTVNYLPAPLTYFNFPDANEAYWCVFTYHNCLVELAGKSRKLWMPTYGGTFKHNIGKNFYSRELGKWDKLVKRTLKAKGFMVKQLMNYVPYALEGGGVHCLSNDLLREQKPPPPSKENKPI